jgi:uncharacterized protein YcbX
MPTLAAITRFPIKGFGPDSLNTAELEPGKLLPFDRHWAVENGGGVFDPAHPVHLTKKHFLMLAGQAELAGIDCKFDTVTGRANFGFSDGVLEISLDDPATHAPLFAKLEDYLGDAIRGQLRIIHAPGQGMTDIPEPHLSLINIASVRDLSSRLGQSLDPLRFRGNLLVDGIGAWDELDWVGRTLRIGAARLRVEARIRRCNAPSVNPETARIDADVTAGLYGQFRHMDCGIYLSVLEVGGVAVGDSVDLER